MAVAHVATTKGSDNSTSTTWTTGTITPNTGELLLVGLVALRSLGSFTVTAKWNGTSMTEDKTTSQVTSGSQNMRVSLFSLPNVSTATAGVAFTFSASTDFKTAFMMRVSGAATSSITDSAGGAANSGGSPGTAAATGSFSSTASDDYWVCVLGSDSGANPATVTNAAAWSIDATNGKETNGAVNMVGGMEYIANPGATSENGQFTISSSNWDVVGMAYKAASGGGSTVKQLAALGVG